MNMSIVSALKACRLLWFVGDLKAEESDPRSLIGKCPDLLEAFAQDPGGHATIILDDGGLQRVYQHCV